MNLPGDHSREAHQGTSYVYGYKQEGKGIMGRIADGFHGGNSEKKSMRARTSRASMLENAHTYSEKVEKEMKVVKAELESERGQLAKTLDSAVRQNLERELRATQRDAVIQKVTKKEGELHRIENGIRKKDMPDIDKEIKDDIKVLVEKERSTIVNKVWSKEVDQKAEEIRSNTVRFASIEKSVLNTEYVAQLTSIQSEALAQAKEQFQLQHGYPAEGKDLRAIQKQLQDPALVAQQKSEAIRMANDNHTNGRLDAQIEQAVRAEAERKVQLDPGIKKKIDKKVEARLKKRRETMFSRDKDRLRTEKVAVRVEARIAEIAEKKIKRLVDKEVDKLVDGLIADKTRIIAEGRVAKQFKEDQHKVLEAYEQQAINMGPTSSPRSLRYRWLDSVRHPLKYRESHRDMVIARWEDMKNLDVLNKRLSMGDDAELVLHSMGMSRATSTQKALEEAKEKLSALDVRMKALMGPEIEAFSQGSASPKGGDRQNPFAALKFDDEGDLLPGKSGEKGGSNRDNSEYIRMQNMRNIVMYLNHQQSMALDLVRASREVSSSISDRKKAIFDRAAKMVELRQKLREQIWKEKMDMRKLILESWRDLVRSLSQMTAVRA